MAQSSNNSVQFPPLSAIGQGRFPSMSSPTHNVDHPFEDAMTYSRETRADPPNLRTEDWENRLAALPEDNRESKHLERQGKPKRRSLSERCSEKWKQVRRGFSSHFNRPAQDTIVTPTTNNGSLLRGTTQNTRYTLSTPDVHHLPLPTPPSNFVSLENLLPDKPEAVNQLLRPSTASQHDLSYPPIPQSNHESVARTRSTTSDGDRRDLRPRVSFDSRLKYGPCPQPDRDSSKRSRSAGSSCRSKSPGSVPVLLPFSSLPCCLIASLPRRYSTSSPRCLAASTPVVLLRCTRIAVPRVVAFSFRRLFEAKPFRSKMYKEHDRRCLLLFFLQTPSGCPAI